jgi:hypothetical protein
MVLGKALLNKLVDGFYPPLHLCFQQQIMADFTRASSQSTLSTAVSNASSVPSVHVSPNFEADLVEWNSENRRPPSISAIACSVSPGLDRLF